MKTTVTLIFTFFLFCFCACPVSGQGPEYEGGNWYYRNSDGITEKETFVVIEGTSYYFDGEGRLKTDCVISSGGFYFGLEENGAMIRNGWKKADFTDEGEISPDGSGGSEKGWMYFGFNGKAFCDGWLSDGKAKYHFTGSKMDFGWYTDEDGSVYYLGGADDGKVHTGWFVWKGAEVPGNKEHPYGWYYFSESTGKMAAGREMEINGAFYAFTADGTEASGFCVIENGNTRKEKYFDPSTGKRASGWMYVAADSETEEHPEGWYYFIDGVPLSASFRTIILSETAGTAAIDGAYYAFDTNGKMLSGIVSAANGKMYYFGSDGKMMTGLVNISGNSEPEEYLLFECEGSAPPALGGSVTGLKGEYVYDQGKRLTAEEDLYEKVHVVISGESRYYIVSQDGRIRRNGTVTLENGKTMRIFSKDGSYDWKQE